MNTKKFNAFKKKAVKFKVQDNHSFYQNSKNASMHQVVNDFVERQTIFHQLDNESDHKRRESTY